MFVDVLQIHTRIILQKIKLIKSDGTLLNDLRIGESVREKPKTHNTREKTGFTHR